MTYGVPIDEMVDGRGGLRPHWRGLLGAFGGLGPGGLAERLRLLDRAFDEEGVSSILPGAAGQAWRCDPVPLLVPAAEFAALESGLAQRADLLEAILRDLYGAQSLLADGVLPPALVYANPAWLRPYDTGVANGSTNRPARYIDFYAADLVRGPDGAWRVLADRTSGAAGVGYAQENRRLLSRVMPEAFRGAQIRALQPFMDIWQNALQRAAPAATVAGAASGRSGPAVALLTPGSASPHWFEHMYLARALSCALVEGGDLTVRGGALFLKTLRGLQQVDVLLRRLDGRMLDPLELEVGSALGVTGLMDAMRAGSVRVVNDPGSGAVEAPALAAWLPSLCLRLLGETLRLASVPTMWLGEAQARGLVLADPARWLLRPALDGRAPAVPLGAVSEEARASLLAAMEARPWAHAATAALPPSVAPSAGSGGLEPRPIMLRLFMVHDGQGWRALQGGLARVLEAEERLTGELPRGGLSKDVWVLAEDHEETIGPSAVVVPPLPIRRTTGELPSRLADNLFWLGRYVERLETAARLGRAALARIDRDNLLPHEIAELMVLTRCLVDLRVVSAEAMPVGGSTRALADALLATVRDTGMVGGLFAEVAQLTEVVRDRLTSDMYAAFTQALRAAHAETQRVRRSLDALAHAMTGIVRFSALVAGIAAESMVRGGGWLFLDLGRRVERAMSVSQNVASALDLPPPRVEAGLRLVLELCDSAITYRGRYMTVVQPAPVLDLVLADEGNPRGLSFQLIAIRRLLEGIAGRADASLPAAASQLLDEAGALVQRVLKSPEQATEAALLAVPLRNIAHAVMGLSDRITRRYFALLPAIQTVGVEPTTSERQGPVLRGAA